jgi:Fe-S cluster assembly iron-binding protein IscA
MLMLTEQAADVIHELTSRPEMPATTGLRISPSPGNTAGPAFAASLTEGPAPSDQVVEVAQAKVFLEQQTAEELSDKILDAQVDEQGAVAFRVVPQEDQSA